MRNSCNYDIEQNLLNQSYKNICGIDEVGRGAVFGPVVSAAVILDPQKLDDRITDSKKLSHKKRLQLAAGIYDSARAYSIGWCWNDEIDEVNILEATKKSIKMAIKGLQIFPDYVLLDGMKPDFVNVEGEGIVKGDAKSLSIAAASILAKVFRDGLVTSFAYYFPQYLLQNNKGYPTSDHIEALAQNGMTAFHRKSFRIKKWQTND